MLPDLPLHPIVVHFPIALLVVGLLVDVAGLALRRDWLKKAGLLLLILGTLGAVAAARTGEGDEEAVEETPAVEEVLETHEDSGKLTMWFFLGVTVLRAGLTWWRKFPAAVHWIFTAIWVAGLVLLIRTAHYGGELVYHHGTGVSAAGVPGAPEHRGRGRDDDD
jgi:uncharacterized membrane protein